MNRLRQLESKHTSQNNQNETNRDGNDAADADADAAADEDVGGEVVEKDILSSTVDVKSRSGDDKDPVNQKISLMNTLRKRNGSSNSEIATTDEVQGDGDDDDDRSVNNNNDISNLKVSLLQQRSSMGQTPVGRNGSDNVTIQPRPGAVSVTPSTGSSLHIHEQISENYVIEAGDGEEGGEREEGGGGGGGGGEQEEEQQQEGIHSANQLDSELIQAELVNEDEIAQMALERTVRAHAEPWTSAQDLPKDDTTNDMEGSKMTHKKWIILFMILIVLVVVTVVAVVVASNDNNAGEKQLTNPADNNNNNNNTEIPFPSPSSTPTTPPPTVWPTNAPTQLQWQSKAQLDGYFVEDSYGDNLVGQNGRFGWHVAITNQLRMGLGYDDMGITVWASFAEDQLFQGRRQLRPRKKRDLLALSTFYQIAVFACDNKGCSEGNPIQTIDDAVFPGGPYPFRPWTLSFTQDATAMAIAAGEELFVVYGSLSFMENLTPYLKGPSSSMVPSTAPVGFSSTTSTQTIVDAKISQDGSFIVSLLPSSMTLLQSRPVLADDNVDWTASPEITRWPFPVDLQMVALATSGKLVAAVGHHGDLETLLQPENLPFTGYTLQVYNVDTGLTIGQIMQVPEGESVLSSRSLAMTNNGSIMALGSSREDIPRSIEYANRQDEGRVTVWQLVRDGPTSSPTMQPTRGTPMSSDAPVSFGSMSSDTPVSFGSMSSYTPVSFGSSMSPDSGGDLDIGSESFKWAQMGSVLEGTTTGNMFGHSVALSEDGTILAVGAPNDPTNGVGAGLVSVYSFDGTDWRKLGDDLLGRSPTSLFGWSVDVSPDGRYVLVGAPGSDARGENVGQVFLYSLAGI